MRVLVIYILITLILNLLFSNCAITFPRPNYPGIVDPVFKSYIDTYKDLKLKYKNQHYFDSVSVNFGEVKEGTIGLCSYEHKMVTIDPVFWNSASEWDREELIFHELGHCDLERDHLDSGFSIMNYRHFNGTFYGKYRTYFIKELFQVIPVESDLNNLEFYAENVEPVRLIYKGVTR